MFNGAAVRELRGQLGWRREELAVFLGVPEAEVASWESGRSQPANEHLGALYRLADSNLISFDPFRPVDPSRSPAPDPFSEPRLSKVKNLVETHFAEPITLREAAGAACLETKYFSKYFRRRVGSPFSTWVASLRVERATELLVKTEQPVSQIGYAVGFQSIRTFERRFKRLTGCCPLEYRTKRRPLSLRKTSSDET